MIKIEVNTEDNKTVHCNFEVHIEAMNRVAISEFMAALDALNRSDKLILALALKEFMEENFD